MKTSRTRIDPPLLAALRQERPAGTRSFAPIAVKGLCLVLLAASLATHFATAADDTTPPVYPSRALSGQEGSAPDGSTGGSTVAVRPAAAPRFKRANFELELASREVRYVADWVVDSGDSGGMPFALVDKVDAKVFVFYADGRLRGVAAALVGLARGDDAVPGIGNRALSTIRPEERTTPAGRFVASLDRNIRGKEILWVDYDGAVSMHPVAQGTPLERRAQRLASPTPLDNRISFGCINVPAIFFEKVVQPAFFGTNGIVYVLPETKPASKVFASYDVEEHERLHSAGLPAPAPAAAATALTRR